MHAISNPAGMVWNAGNFAGAGGKVVGAGHVAGVATDWAARFEPIPATSSSMSMSPATFKLFCICSNPHILKLLPSYCCLLLRASRPAVADIVCSDCGLVLSHRSDLPFADKLVGFGIFA